MTTGLLFKILIILKKFYLPKNTVKTVSELDFLNMYENFLMMDTYVNLSLFLLNTEKVFIICNL